MKTSRAFQVDWLEGDGELRDCGYLLELSTCGALTSNALYCRARVRNIALIGAFDDADALRQLLRLLLRFRHLLRVFHHPSLQLNIQTRCLQVLHSRF